jgi:uncharacterized membrane protein YraQ (UPF0718 family)
MPPRTINFIARAAAATGYGLGWVLGWLWVLPYFVLKSLVIVARGLRIKLIF